MLAVFEIIGLMPSLNKVPLKAFEDNPKAGIGNYRVVLRHAVTEAILPITLTKSHLLSCPHSPYIAMWDTLPLNPKPLL